MTVTITKDEVLDIIRNMPDVIDVKELVEKIILHTQFTQALRESEMAKEWIGKI